MTERARPEASVQEQAEVQEWVDLVREEWAVPERVLAQGESVCVRNAERLLLMMSEHPVTLRNAPSVEERW